MVVTARPSAWTAKSEHDFTAAPSSRTVQAPHWLVSQPTWVPVSPSTSRRKWTSRTRDSISRDSSILLTGMLTEAKGHCFECGAGIQATARVHHVIQRHDEH